MLLKDRHIFIVEDNSQNRIVFQMALVRHGAAVDFERSGQDTLYQLGRLSRIDLIIIDLMLPGGISGFDVFDDIRSLERYANIPIVAVSAMDPAVAIPKARAKGFAGFIAKPIDNRLFPKQIAQVIEGVPVWHAGERNTV